MPSPRPPASSANALATMRANRSRDTKPEMRLRQLLREAGFPGYRIHWNVPGHPDIAYPGRRVAVFVNGCFWHRCPHCHPPMPKRNGEFWAHKFSETRQRDARKIAELRAMGWHVVTVWECQLEEAPGRETQRVVAALAER